MNALILFLILLTAPTDTGDTEDPPPRLRLSDLSWLEGCWQGTGFGKRVTECWMRAPDGRMTGMFQLIGDDGAQEMSEIFVLDEFEDGPAIRLKHFGPELIGWEARDDFVVFELRETGPDFARFDGLTYRLTAADRLVAELAVTDNGAQRTVRLAFGRLFGPERID